eukprot:CAMPEP_0183306458 /NCGR_PEP_ID=MMETSP0160_2-20130417/11692_1 /TAXON_ID=2839 ORGANISM="Odontella Sinensis, Strain Grunow 1884" /NCGR_SAMPLE_ID=MMETSP0160_2 /ASSEMBLY_ACC=CAM_ASM_000250 /LENGTH=123 /DNA_ID=CAMNT_0025469831 /DNA_START=56 /DNA_END=425 /DNA_ORIENTATION=+
MAEVSAGTELQLLEADIASLKEQLSGVKDAESNSNACDKLVTSIQKNEPEDGFIVVPDADREKSQWQQSHPGSGNEGGVAHYLRQTRYLAKISMVFPNNGHQFNPDLAVGVVALKCVQWRERG